MAGNIGVDIQVVKNTSADIRNQKSTMRTNLRAISEGVNNLKSSWQSEAADQLSTIAANMNGKFDELDKAVEDFALFLDGVAQNYEATERAAVASQQSVANMFNG